MTDSGPKYSHVSEVSSEVSRLHHTGYTVSDLDRSLGFYRDLLGCEVLATQTKQGGYLAAIVGYPDAHVRMAHLRAPDSSHVIELFEYLTVDGLHVFALGLHNIRGSAAARASVNSRKILGGVLPCRIFVSWSQRLPYTTWPARDSPATFLFR